MFSIEKQQLLACLRDDTLILIDLRQNKVIQTFSHNHFQVSSDTNKAILSPDSQYACAGSQDGSIFVWNTTNGVCENALTKKHTYERNPCFHISSAHTFFLEQWSLQ